MDIQETLTDKAGPFPVWVWGLMLGGVVVGVMWFNGRGTDYTDTVTGDEYTATGTDSLSGIDDAIQYDGDNSNDVIDSTEPEDLTPEPVEPETGPESNAEWLSRGTAFLITRGHNPLKAQKSLTKYLNGQKLTQSQAALVNAVITRYGLPPEGAPVAQVVDAPGPSGGGGDDGGGGGNSGPVTTTVKVPSQIHVVTGKNDDNWGELAVMYYGTKGGGNDLKIRTANPAKTSPIKKGLRVRIPAGTKKVTTGGGSGGASVQMARTAAAVPGDVSPNSGSSAQGLYLTRALPMVDRLP